MSETADFKRLHIFFEKSVCQKTAIYLKQGTEIALELDGGSQLSLKKNESSLVLLTKIAESPDLTFYLGKDIPKLLAELPYETTPEIGLSLFEMIRAEQKERKIRIKVHADTFTMIRNGYFRILAAGGAPVMGYLAKFGLGNLAKIKTTISNLRS
jgi:hypothetical protein